LRSHPFGAVKKNSTTKKPAASTRKTEGSHDIVHGVVKLHE
jgi:hypothetical protein